MANLVPGEGLFTSKIWLIGEAPGSNEDRLCRPFVGGSGQVLDSMLAETNIRRSDCYIDNVVQYQPPANNFSIYYSDKARSQPTQELLQAHERIRQMVIQHHPNVVVAFGNESLYALTGHKQITKWRGSILSCGGIKVIPTLHPAMIMRQYEFRTQGLFDLSKVLRESKTPTFPETPPDKFIINPSFEQVLCTLDGLFNRKAISFDIETSKDLQQITCIGLAWSSTEAICIPFFSGSTSFWTLEEEIQIVNKLKELFSKRIDFIAQNAQFDMTFLRMHWGIDNIPLWMDTMIAHHCVYPELPKSLAFLVSIYTNHPYHKDKIHGGLQDYWTYNCMDAARTYECAMAIKNELEEWGTTDLYLNLSHKLIKPLFDMQNFGCKIDVETREKIRINLSADVVAMQRRFELGIGHPINVGSPKQMKELVYEEFKYPTIYRKRKQADGTNKETITVDDDALEELDARFPGNPMFKLIQDIRKVNKLLSTYIEAPLDKDGRIRCSYMITGTATGRLSSRESVFGTGTNLQNIPRDGIVRSLFIPDEGYIMVNADLSQAEARVVAALAGEDRLMRVFEEGEDVHRKNAAMIFQKAPQNISEDERYLGKMLVHAANYMIGPRKFAREAGVAENKARELLNTYYAMYPRIKRWHDEIKVQLGKTRTLNTPLGRKRMFLVDGMMTC
jgi:DNA polymerase-1